MLLILWTCKRHNCICRWMSKLTGLWGVWDQRSLPWWSLSGCSRSDPWNKQTRKQIREQEVHGGLRYFEISHGICRVKSIKTCPIIQTSYTVGWYFREILTCNRRDSFNWTSKCTKVQLNECILYEMSINYSKKDAIKSHFPAWLVYLSCKWISLTSHRVPQWRVLKPGSKLLPVQKQCNLSIGFRKIAGTKVCGWDALKRRITFCSAG